MHCNHCRNSVLRTVGNLPGVDSVEVDLQSSRMTISGTAGEEAIIQAVDALGFAAKAE
ncbi:MAG: heavy-metal-associated domain-containing protein [Bacteroidaceae bacterium]|nr:heavy-metal-associated domain-containing protein [Bacteroidaceae bacterium]